MDAGNFWAVNGLSGDAQNKTIIERIMLRYRPIAPKPAADGSSPGSAAAGDNAELVSKTRKKRKYVRVKQTKRCSKESKGGDKKDAQLDETMFSLQLEAEASGSNGLKSAGSSADLDFSSETNPYFMSFDKSENNGVFGGGESPDPADRTRMTRPVRAVETWVMVDGITDKWLDKEGLGCTDMEKMKNLEVDSCPGMISDGFDRVQWVNLAYRRMVAPNRETETPAEVVVWLILKGKLPAGGLLEAFACTVSVVYTWRKEKHTQTMPCDVWRMDFGGFAWRLDAKAKLSLSL